MSAELTILNKLKQNKDIYSIDDTLFDSVTMLDISGIFPNTDLTTRKIVLNLPPIPIYIPSDYTFYYKFETNFNDEGGIYIPTVYGSIGFVTGQVGQAMNTIVEANDYIDVAPLNLQNFSVSLWWKFTGLGIDSRFFGEDHTNSSNSTESGIAFAFSGVTNELKLKTSNGTLDDFGLTIVDISTYGMIIGNWYNIVITSDSSTAINKIYINGIEEATATRPTDISYIAYTGRDSNFLINSDYYTGISEPNTIDEFLHYSRVLNDQEVLDIYNVQKG